MIFGKKQIQSEVDSGTVLLLQVPRTNDKKELAAEQMFASIHGLLVGAERKSLLSAAPRERVSFEIAVQHKRIGFYVWVPAHLKSFVEEQIYAQYPTVDISDVKDYAMSESVPNSVCAASELKFIANNALPIKTFPSFEVDPLAAITAGLAQFTEQEEAWLQFVVRPASQNWYKKSEKYAAGVRGSNGSTSAGGVVSALWVPPGEAKPAAPKLVEHQTAQASAAEEKSHKLAYETVARIIYRGTTSPAQARMRLQAIAASFKQFNTTYLNGFAQNYLGEDPKYIEQYRARQIHSGFICNIEEIASVFHLPHTNVETPNILWARAKTAEPPANLPLVADTPTDQISPVAATNFRGHNAEFGMPRSDRGRHLYIIGQTGVGKSGMLELLTISDIESPYGFAVIDPHGDYAMNILKRIPENRINDVIYFNPADTSFPIAFNPMEVYDDKLKTHTCSELIGVLKRMFESWGPRLEYILRYSLLALLDYPDSTMLDITRILTDKKFRNEVLEHVQDPVVLNFWKVEFASWNERFAAEAVAPVLNKVGAFTANPTVRNIIGQPKSSFNIRQIMDERKILIVNLSRGLIGEDNASLLGALLVTKIQMGAMSRADIALEDRIPFNLYVDEFQNFATDSFATILSEARKYALNLTVANQYIAQMSMEVKDAVFGNVGSIVSFRAGADDARVMLKYFEPKFEETDMVHMHNRNFVISMTIDGEKAQAFSATTLTLPECATDYSQEIINQSRKAYAFNLSEVEDYIKVRYLEPGKKMTKQSAVVQKASISKLPDQSKSTPKANEDDNLAQSVTSKAELEPETQSANNKTPRDSAGLSKKIGNTITKSFSGSVQPNAPNATDQIQSEPAPKRKRKRTRRRKKPAGTPDFQPVTRQAQSSTPNTTNPQQNNDPNQKPPQPSQIDETVIHLR